MCSGTLAGEAWVPATLPMVHGVVGKVPVKAGAVNVSSVGDVTVVWTGTEFTTTRMLPMKLPPVIVTGPPPWTTEAGVMLVMNGLTLFTKYVKLGPWAFGQLSEELFTWTAAVMSVQDPVRRACGVTAMICSDETETVDHAVPPPLTAAGSSKLWPEMMTCVPPVYGPKVGPTVVIVGQG